MTSGKDREKLTKERNRLLKEVAALEKQNADLKAKLDSTKAALAASEGELTELRIQAVDDPEARKQIAALVVAIEKQREEVENAGYGLISLDRKIEAARKDLKEMEDRLAIAVNETVLARVLAESGRYDRLLADILASSKRLSVGTDFLKKAGWHQQLRQARPGLELFPPPGGGDWFDGVSKIVSLETRMDQLGLRHISMTDISSAEADEILQNLRV